MLAKEKQGGEKAKQWPVQKTKQTKHKHLRKVARRGKGEGVLGKRKAIHFRKWGVCPGRGRLFQGTVNGDLQ